MWLKERVYRLPIALLVLMALVASVPLMASAEEEESEYFINEVDAPVAGGNASIDGNAEGGDFTGMTVSFEGAVTGSTTVNSSGEFFLITPSAGGDATAILKDSNGDEVDRYDFDAYL